MIEKYYDLKFTPAYGSVLINIAISSINHSVPITSIFTVFPLLYNDDFLNYIQKKRIKSLSRIVNEYSNKEKKSNEFWLDYSIRSLSMRRLCFESLYLGIVSKQFELNDDGITINRIMYKEIDVDIEKVYSIMKLGDLAFNMALNELLKAMKVGE